MLTLFTAVVLAAGPDPSMILTRVDRAANGAKDATMQLSVTVTNPDGSTLQRSLTVWQLGADRRMVKFTGPARLRGTGILVDGGQTWLYAAAYKRVRRVAGKAGGGSWMGTGFSINDLARVRFSQDYVPALESETEAQWVLKLEPKDKEAHDHHGLRLTVRKSDDLVARIEKLNADGSAQRTIVADRFAPEGAYSLAHRIAIQDHASGKTTTAEVTEARFDTGLGADWFTQRQLQRSP